MHPGDRRDHLHTHNQVTLFFPEGTSAAAIEHSARQLEALVRKTLGGAHVCQDVGHDLAVEGCQYVTMRNETITKHGFDVAQFLKDHAHLFVDKQKQYAKLISANAELTRKEMIVFAPTTAGVDDDRTEDERFVYRLVKILDYADIEDAATVKKWLVEFFSSTAPSAPSAS